MRPPTAARNAVAVVFALNGFAFASLAARVPALRDGLALDNRGLGALLLVIAAGSLTSLTTSGRLIEQWGAARVVLVASVVGGIGLTVVGFGVTAGHSVAVAAAGLFAYGAGTGAWDVAMNVEGAAVERRWGRTIMPRFHAAWSLGSITGAGVGVGVVGGSVPLLAHLAAISALTIAVAAPVVRRFLAPAASTRHPPRARTAWREPRTVLVGVLVLCFAATEGAANDWLTLALIDGHDVPPWLGVAGLALFVAAMTCGRLLGPVLLDHIGRAPVLACSALAAAAGVGVVVFGDTAPVVGCGIVLWGLGAALGFPVGMSAAADDPVGAPARVAVVSTIGYAAFLAGPPVFGLLGDAVGTLRALLAVAALMLVSLLVVGAVRQQSRLTPQG